MSTPLKVAVGVLENTCGEILIARRQQGKHLAGFWEFPGGKIEAQEDCKSALLRELKEEIAFDVSASFHLSPLITLNWDYGHKCVELQVMHISAYTGKAQGNEGQEITWLARDKLSTVNFPPANKAIISALNLPAEVLITAEEESDEIFLERLTCALESGIQLVQLRAKTLDRSGFQHRVEQVLKHIPVSEKGPRFILNCPPDFFKSSWPANIHLTSQLLMQSDIEASIKRFEFVSASVHNEQEMAKANELQLDCVFCSPVKATRSHPGKQPLQWSGFEALCKRAQVPVYALGGLTSEDRAHAIAKGAQGIAAIRAFWEDAQ